MPLQYVKNIEGETTAVMIPIEEWESITQKYTDLSTLEKSATGGKKKASDYKGILPLQVAEALHQHIQQSREEWD